MPQTELTRRLEENLRSVETRIETAAIRSGRLFTDVILVAVTKYAHLDWVRALVAMGLRNLGENRPQQLLERAEQLPSGLDWHLIGHLQSNKAKRLLPFVQWIHSIDSIKLLRAVDRLAEEFRDVTRNSSFIKHASQLNELSSGKVERANLRPKLLMEVNITGEVSKDGFTPEELRRDWESVCECQNITVLGLMTMAPANPDPENARPAFRALRKFRDELQARSPSHIQLSQLSMGMTGDFEVGIEEGATLVRIGSALFEGLEETNIPPTG